jgi:cell division FtsZ-interacting protein ZapD
LTPEPVRGLWRRQNPVPLAAIPALLRLNLTLADQLYPQISGHKSRFAIRFMPLDSEHGVVPERLDFELACC